MTYAAIQITANLVSMGVGLSTCSRAGTAVVPTAPDEHGPVSGAEDARSDAPAAARAGQ